jgi:two-component system sensor histidine kinase RegB
MLNSEWFSMSIGREDRVQINLLWMLRLRWSAIIGQLLTVIVTQWLLRIDIPWQMLLGIIFVEIGSNFIFWRLIAEPRMRGQIGEAVLGAVMVLDVGFLTALLYASGGPTNPFSVFYIINICLAASVLSSRWAWTLTTLALLGYAGLFNWHIPVAALGHNVHSEHQAETQSATSLGKISSLDLHLQGMLLAFGGAAAFVAYFVTRVRRELDRREAELSEVERRRAMDERLQSVVTLAAGAAHELSTPLSSILIAAKEVEFHVKRLHEDAALREELNAIESEIRRCQKILATLTSHAGELMGEPWQCLSVDELLQSAVAETKSSDRFLINAAPDIRAVEIDVPRMALSQALVSLLRNALDASEQNQPVAVNATIDQGQHTLRVVVADQGNGMPAEVLKRLGEPFFTTRPPGKGMGLGVFVAKRVVAEIGGKLQFASHLGKGTAATIEFPLLQLKCDGSHSQVTAKNGS